MIATNTLGSRIPRLGLTTSSFNIIGWPGPRTRSLRSTAWLDGLRGIAAFQVMIFHFIDIWIELDFGYGANEDSYQWYRLPVIRTVWASGRSMVCAFFVISGYVLTQRTLLALRRGQPDQALKNISSAIFRRAVRLFPPAVVSCMFGFLLVRLGIRGSKDDTYLPYYDSIWSQILHFCRETFRFLNIFTYTLRTFGGDLMHCYEGVVWSIPMEFTGSMAIYLGVMGSARLSPTGRNLFILAIAIFGLIQGTWTIFCFYAGIIIADLQISSGAVRDSPVSVLPLKLRNVLWSLVFLQGFWMAGAPMRGPLANGEIALGFNWQWFLVPESYFHLDINYTCWSVAGLLLLISTSQLYYAKNFLETTACQYLGRVSFSIYLNHIWTRDLVGVWLKIKLESIFGDMSFGPLIAFCLWNIVMVMVTLVVANIFEKVIDAPVVRFAKYLENICIVHHNPGAAHDRLMTSTDISVKHDGQELSELLPFITSSNDNETHDHSLRTHEKGTV